MATRARQYSQQEIDFLADMKGDDNEFHYSRTSAEKLADLSFVDDDDFNIELDLESVFNSIDENLHQSSINSDGYFENSFVD